jgi:hypothetical protein
MSSHIPPPPHVNSFVLGPAVINNTHTTPSFTQSLSPRSLVRDESEQTSLHRPRLVVSRSTCHMSTCPPISPPSPRKQLCTRSCSNKHTHIHTPPPHTGFPMSAHLSRLRLFQRHLRSLVWVWVVGLGLGLNPHSHSSSHALPFFSPPSFHTLTFSPAFTSVWLSV